MLNRIEIPKIIACLLNGMEDHLPEPLALRHGRLCLHLVALRVGEPGLWHNTPKEVLNLTGLFLLFTSSTKGVLKIARYYYPKVSKTLNFKEGSETFEPFYFSASPIHKKAWMSLSSMCIFVIFLLKTLKMHFMVYPFQLQIYFINI